MKVDVADVAGGTRWDWHFFDEQLLQWMNHKSCFLPDFRNDELKGFGHEGLGLFGPPSRYQVFAMHLSAYVPPKSLYTWDAQWANGSPVWHAEPVKL